MYTAMVREGQGGGPRPARTRRPQAHVPVTFDPAAVTRPEWAAYAEWVVSLVVFRRFLDKDADEATFVPLATAFLEQFVPPKVRRPLLDDLIRGGVLECDDFFYFGSYADGKRGKCMCYRLGPAYRGERLGARPVTHRWLAEKIEAARVAERAAVTDPVHVALRAWHDQVEVTADAPYGENVLLNRMMDGERRFTVCAQGRCHTNVANLPAQYRQFVRLAGRELESVDISTSQPLLLAILLRKGHKEARGRGGEEDQVIYRPGSCPSLTVYLEDCLAGVVYDKVAAETGYARDQVKSMFLAVVYGHPDHMGTKVGLAVKTLYPAVYDAVAEMNFRLGHGGLPRLMQRVESGVMIGRVAARLLREEPDMPLLTVHDSILAPAEYIEYVEAVIKEEWQAEFGVVPGTKRSAFTDPQEPRRKRARRPGSGKETVVAAVAPDPVARAARDDEGVRLAV